MLHVAAFRCSEQVLDAAEVQELELDSEAEDEMELESPEDTTSGTSSGHSQEPSASGTWELRWSGLEAPGEIRANNEPQRSPDVAMQHGVKTHKLSSHHLDPFGK